MIIRDLPWLFLVVELRHLSPEFKAIWRTVACFGLLKCEKFFENTLSSQMTKIYGISGRTTQQLLRLQRKSMNMTKCSFHVIEFAEYKYLNVFSDHIYDINVKDCFCTR